MPDEVRIEAAKRYIQAYELITGRKFVVMDEPVEQRIAGQFAGKGYMKK